MHWPGHLREARRAGDLDRQAAGGAPSATASRFNGRHPPGACRNDRMAVAAGPLRKRTDDAPTETLSRDVPGFCRDAFRRFAAPGVPNREGTCPPPRQNLDIS